MQPEKVKESNWNKSRRIRILYHHRKIRNINDNKDQWGEEEWGLRVQWDLHRNKDRCGSAQCPTAYGPSDWCICLRPSSRHWVTNSRHLSRALTRIRHIHMARRDSLRIRNALRDWTTNRQWSARCSRSQIHRLRWESIWGHASCKQHKLTLTSNN